MRVLSGLSLLLLAGKPSPAKPIQHSRCQSTPRTSRERVVFFRARLDVMGSRVDEGEGVKRRKPHLRVTQTVRRIALENNPLEDTRNIYDKNFKWNNCAVCLRSFIRMCLLFPVLV